MPTRSTGRPVGPNGIRMAVHWSSFSITTRISRRSWASTASTALPQVIGFAFDGTGYGPDGAVWGGEVMLADYKGFQRISHLRYVPIAGGDISVERPYRMALSHLRAAGIEWTSDIPAVAACPEIEQRVLRHQLETGFGVAPTSSMGRLFDAVASLANVRHVVDYEAEAAIEFEGLTRGASTDEP